MVYTLGTIWGVFLHAAPGRLRLDWNPLLRRLAWSFAQPHAGPTERLVVAEVESVHAHTGDPVEDALVDAVAAIVARVGMERGTGSRIARRAGLTSGAIYGRYETKEDLLQHAIEILLAQRFTDDLASIDEVLWVFNGYLLAYAVLLITAGRLGDVFGPRNLFAVDGHAARTAE